MDLYNAYGGMDRKRLGYYITAYGIAVKHGFNGTEEEWLASLKGEQGTATEMRYNPVLDQLEWKLKTESEWTGVLPLAVIRGTAFDEAVASIKDSTETAKESKEAAEASAQIAKEGKEAATAAAERAETAKGQAEELKRQAEESSRAAGNSKVRAETAAVEAKESERKARLSETAAAEHKERAHIDAGKAETKATESKSWAVGGTGTRNGEDTNNAKYYAGIASAAAGGGVTSFNGRGGAVIPQKEDYSGLFAGDFNDLREEIKNKSVRISTTDEAFINMLTSNTGKVGQDYLFGSKGDKNGTISESLGFTLYQSLNNCVHYSGYQIDVVNLRGQNEGLRDAHFKEPAYYLATFVEVKKVAIRILTTPIEVTNDLIDSSTERALSAAQGKWLNENKLGKNDKAADSDKLDGHDSTYFATSADVQTAQRAANQGVNAAAAAHGRANEAYSRAEQAFTSASNGKIKIANAITGKGIPTSTTASWQEMAGNIGKIQSLKMLRSKDYVKDDFRCISYYYKDDMDDYKTLKQKTELTNFKKEPFPVIDDTDTVLGCSFGSSSYEHYVDFLILRKPIDLTNVKTILVHAYPTFGSTSETHYDYYSAPNIVMACSLKEVADLTAMIPKSIEENSIIFYQQYKTSYDRYTRGRVFRTNKNIIGERYLVFGFAHNSGSGSFLFSHIELF